MIHRQMLLTMVFGSVLAGSVACSSPAAAPKEAVRILIEFRAPVDGASVQLLAELGQSAGVPVRYRTSASARLHAYELACPATDPDCRQAIENLREAPAIVSISADQLRRLIHEPSKP